MKEISKKLHKQCFRQNMKQTIKLIKRNWILYLFLLPTITYAIMFWYAPMYGVQIAFRNYRIADGINGSEWVGLYWIKRFLDYSRFAEVFKNTIVLSLYSLAAGFPLPIILAVMMNNIRNKHAKKFVQTVTYMPHFISTVVLVGMMSLFFSPYGGVVNTIISWFGGSGNTNFMGNPEYFRHMYVWTGVWQGTGWSSIIYMAALSGVDQQLHEAAIVDGANKFQRVLHVDIPSIVPTICIILIMNCGHIMSLGYEKVYLMQNDLNTSVSEIITTYVYKMGLMHRQYSFSSAIGLFNSVINFALVVSVNKIVKKSSGTGLW